MTLSLLKPLLRRPAGAGVWAELVSSTAVSARERSWFGRLGHRRRRDATLLAGLALAAVWILRSSGQPIGVMIGEAAAVLGLFAAGRSVGYISGSVRPLAEKLGRLFGPAALLVPLCSRVAIQASGGLGTAWEMVMLTTLGIAAITLTFCSDHHRHSALAVVCSGFLMLFTTAISDQVGTFYLSILWVLICLWWMLGNQWERLEVHLAQSVHKHRGIRFAMMGFGLAVCAAALLVSWGRGPAARMLDGGVMPTSGGTRWADPSARSGVGDGDAVVAAKKHAASFGAVESELFLQSHQPSLFDLFDDVLGKPRPVRRSEKAVSLPNQTPRGQQRGAAQSQQGDAAFSTARESVPKLPKLTDKKTAALLQWVGPTGVRLALQRYDHFDGLQWTHEVPLGEAGHQHPGGATPSRLRRQELGQRVWFFRAAASAQAAQSALLGPARGDAVKIVNLRSPRIPAPATTAAVHIADIGRDDFFDISSDGSFYMPGRRQVPSLTVVRLITHEVDGDRLRAIRSLPRDEGPESEFRESGHPVRTEGIALASRLARDWTQGTVTDWERVERVVTRLREDFIFDRLAENSGDDPLANFLTHRRGGDHLFATAATVMLRELGFRARLAAGFYVPTGGRDMFAGNVEILAHDAHVWTEVLAEADVWLPLEPTPGYAPPRYYRTFWKRAAEAGWAAIPWIALVLVGGALLWRVRSVWGEWCCRTAWSLSRPLPSRRRLALLIRLLDLRGRLAGRARPPGVTPRRWVEQATPTIDLSLRDATSRFFDVADAAFYGPRDRGDVCQTWLEDANRIASGLTVKTLIRTKQLKVSSP